MNGVAVTGTHAFVNPDKMSTTTVSDEVSYSNEGTPIFLQTRAAQCIAGVFVWVALFLTCQQVLVASWMPPAIHIFVLDQMLSVMQCYALFLLCVSPIVWF